MWLTLIKAVVAFSSSASWPSRVGGGLARAAGHFGRSPLWTAPEAVADAGKLIWRTSAQRRFEKIHHLLALIAAFGAFAVTTVIPFGPQVSIFKPLHAPVPPVLLCV